MSLSIVKRKISGLIDRKLKAGQSSVAVCRLSKGPYINCEQLKTELNLPGYFEIKGDYLVYTDPVKEISAATHNSVLNTPAEELQVTPENYHAERELGITGIIDYKLKDPLKWTAKFVTDSTKILEIEVGVPNQKVVVEFYYMENNVESVKELELDLRDVKVEYDLTDLKKKVKGNSLELGLQPTEFIFTQNKYRVIFKKD